MSQQVALTTSANSQAHNVKATSYRSRCDMTSHRRWYNVTLRLCACWVRLRWDCASVQYCQTLCCSHTLRIAKCTIFRNWQYRSRILYYKDALHTRFQCVVRACDLNCFETRISTYQHDARFMNIHKLNKFWRLDVLPNQIASFLSRYWNALIVLKLNRVLLFTFFVESSGYKSVLQKCLSITV